MISLNLLLENKGDPVVWRGSLLSGVVKQFWTDVRWGQLDYLFIDMPPEPATCPSRCSSPSPWTASWW